MPRKTSKPKTTSKTKIKKESKVIKKPTLDEELSHIKEDKMFKKILKRITAFTVAAMIGISLVPTSFKVDAATKIGWNHDDNFRYYKSR